MIDVDYKVDAKGLACPMPIVKTRKIVKEMPAGRVLEVEATDKGSTADLQAWAKSAGHEYIGTVEEEEGILKHYLRKVSEEERSETKFSSIITNEQLKSLMDCEKEIVLLDVREVSEYAFGHIPRAVSVPLGEIEQTMKTLNPVSEIYVICRTGNRSDLAAQQLADAGFEKVFNVVPGMHKWEGNLNKKL